jgi:hypothetical protein
VECPPFLSIYPCSYGSACPTVSHTGIGYICTYVVTLHVQDAKEEIWGIGSLAQATAVLTSSESRDDVSRSLYSGGMFVSFFLFFFLGLLWPRLWSNYVPSRRMYPNHQRLSFAPCVKIKCRHDANLPPRTGFVLETSAAVLSPIKPNPCLNPVSRYGPNWRRFLAASRSTIKWGNS